MFHAGFFNAEKTSFKCFFPSFFHLIVNCFPAIDEAWSELKSVGAAQLFT
jgi:hypothetical protein